MTTFRKYRAFIFLAALVASTLVLALFWRTEKTVHTLRWAHVYEIGSPYHQHTLAAAKEFEKQTNGRYRIRVYPASALGSESAINEALALGAIDIIYSGASFVANEHPPIALSDFPYAIDSFDHWKAYRDSPLFDQIAADFGKATDTKVIGLTYYGFRHVTANKLILHPDDMKGLKIRVPNAPMFLILPKATNANAAPMPFAEVYLGLQQGVVDAQENPLTTIQFKRFYEVQTHINLTGHIVPSLLTLVSQSTLNKLGAEDAALLQDIARLAAENASTEIADTETELVSWFEEKALTVSPVDREAFRNAVDTHFEGRDYPFDPSYLQKLRELSSQ